MRTIEEIVGGFYAEAQSDFIGLWMIAPTVRRDLSLSNNAEVKARTLVVVRGLLDRGLWPGDYLKTGFHPWDEPDASACIARIDSDWDTAKGDPTLPDSICWFDFRKS
jgi:hypothetical protein